MQSFYGLGEDDPCAPGAAGGEADTVSGPDAAAGGAGGPWGAYLKGGGDVPEAARPRLGFPQQQGAAAPPPLLHEVVDAVLAPGVPGVYVDATFGRGAYSAELLRRLPPSSRLIILVDARANPSSAAAAQALMREDPRVADVIPKAFHEAGPSLAGMELAGVVLDLGVAYQHQGQEANRGFSSVDDVPLDLRLDASEGVPAEAWLSSASVSEIAWVLHAYGEDDDPLTALRVAEAIVDRWRRRGPCRTVYQLVEVVRRAKGTLDERGLHPARLTLQALRVFLNGDLEKLGAFLEDAMSLLAPGGRLAIVTTRRPEAATVKAFMRSHENPHPLLEGPASAQRLPELYPLLRTGAPFAVVQASEPMWPSAALGQRGPRSLACHVLQRVRRRQPEAQEGGEAWPPERGVAQLFSPPRPLPFGGGA